MPSGSGEEADGFHMRRAGEHIHRLKPPDLIALLQEQSGVPGQGGAVAGNIYQPVRSHTGYGIQQFGAAALAGRIDEDHRRADPLVGQLLCGGSGVTTEEAGIFNAVFSGVFSGVFHRIGDDLHADDLFDLVRQTEADGPGSAVEIQQNVLRLQCGKFAGDAVELFGAVVIDLIKGHRRQVELHPAEGVGDVIFPIEQAVFAAEHHIGFFPIDVENDAADLRETGGHRIDELPAVGEFAAVDDQTEHHLTGDLSPAQVEMPDQSFSGGFLVDRNMETVDKFLQKLDDL